MDALADGWRRLRRSAIALHLDRPRIGLGAVRLTGGFLCLFTGMPGVNLCAHDLAAPYDLARFRAHGGHYSDLGMGLQLY